MSVRGFLILLSALHGLAGVTFSAIGAHVPGAAAVETGATMQLVHGVASIAVLGAIRGKIGEFAAIAFIAGALLFAVGVYSSGLGGISLGLVAPTGGALLMTGWLVVAVAAYRMGRE